MKASNDNLADDILKGADAIASFTGLDRRSIYYAVSTGKLPTFRVGSGVFARKSTLLTWIANQEQGLAA